MRDAACTQGQDDIAVCGLGDGPMDRFLKR